MDITGRLTYFALLFNVDSNPKQGMFLLFLTIVVLAIIAFKLGFAQKLSLMKALIVYAILIFGCTILTFLGAFVPIAEGLLVTVIVLALYKIRNRKKISEGAS